MIANLPFLICYGIAVIAGWELAKIAIRNKIIIRKLPDGMAPAIDAMMDNHDAITKKWKQKMRQDIAAGKSKGPAWYAKKAFEETTESAFEVAKNHQKDKES